MKGKFFFSRRSLFNLLRFLERDARVHGCKTDINLGHGLAVSGLLDIHFTYTAFSVFWFGGGEFGVQDQQVCWYPSARILIMWISCLESASFRRSLYSHSNQFPRVIYRVEILPLPKVFDTEAKHFTNSEAGRMLHTRTVSQDFRLLLFCLKHE